MADLHVRKWDAAGETGGKTGEVLSGQGAPHAPDQAGGKGVEPGVRGDGGAPRALRIAEQGNPSHSLQDSLVGALNQF